MANQMLLIPVLISFLAFQSVTCQTCPACPTNGIWSDWNATAPCSTPCGACSSVTQTRTCLSSDIGCPCTGEATTTVPCNTHACGVVQTNSRIKPCCTGTPKLTNNLYYCVPPVEQPKLACCPSKGYWSNWGTYVKTPNKISWTRTRRCISENSNCPCVGDKTETKIECPCTPPTVLPGWDTTCQKQPNLFMSNYTLASAVIATRPLVVVRPSRCEAYSMFEASPYRDEFVWQLYNPNVTTMLLGNVDERGYCTVRQIFGGKIELSGSILPITFTCNLTTLRYDYANLTSLYKISQFAMHST